MAKTVTLKVSREIKRRLEGFAGARSGSWYKFSQESGYPHSTTSSWRNPRVGSLPSAAVLIQLARRFGLSLDWLLLGEGQELRGVSRTIPALHEDVRLYVEHALGVPDDDRGEAIRAALPSGDEILGTLVEIARARVEAGKSEWWNAMEAELANRVRAEQDPKQRGVLGQMLANVVRRRHSAVRNEA